MAFKIIDLEENTSIVLVFEQKDTEWIEFKKLRRECWGSADTWSSFSTNITTPILQKLGQYLSYSLYEKDDAIT